MFSLCSNMRWNHLPVAGGLYDQDPVLLDRFEYMFGEIAKKEESDRAKQKAEQEAAQRKAQQGSGRSKHKGRRR